MSQARKPLLGSGRARAVAFSAPALAPGAALILASDGLVKYAPAARLCALVRDGADATALVAAARLPSGALQDDTTVIVCR